MVPAPVPHVVPLAQVQAPLWQLVPLGQAIPQPPQLEASPVVSTQVPPQQVPLPPPGRVQVLPVWALSAAQV